MGHFHESMHPSISRFPEALKDVEDSQFTADFQL